MINNQYDSELLASYDSEKSVLLNQTIFSAKCGLREDCLEYNPPFTGSKGKGDKKDKNSKIGCCVGLGAYFILPNYDYDNINFYNSFSLKILFNNSSDIELFSVPSFTIPNILTISYLDEIIISLIYDANFENRNIELYHPVTKLVNKNYLEIILPKTNGNIQNINL
jgi:hypothetical protein